MRKLTKSETRLFLLFCSAIFVAVNLLGIRLWTQKRGAVILETRTLQATIAEDRSWIELVDGFGAIKTWLAQNPPPQMAADSASTDLLNTVRKLAEDQGLTINGESLMPNEPSGEFNHVDLQIKLSGPFFGVVRLLFDLQKPETWRAMEKITIKSDKTPTDAVVEMQVRQYYDQAGAPAPQPES